MPAAPSEVICEECGRVFSSRRSLSAHRRKHEAPVHCPMCGEPVRYLAAHLSSKHPIQDEWDHVIEGMKRLVETVRTLQIENSQLRAQVDSTHSDDSPIPREMGESNRIVESGREA